MSEEDFLIKTLYSSLVDDSGFKRFLSVLRQRLNLLSGAVVMLNKEFNQINLVWTEGIDIDVAHQFLGNHHQDDPLINRLNASKTGSLVVFGNSEARQFQQGNPEFFAKVNQFGIYYALGAELSNDGHWRSHLLFHRSKEQGEFDAEECHLIRQLLPHIQHAMMLYHQKQEQDNRHVLTDMLFDQIQIPIFLINQTGFISHFNQQADIIMNQGNWIRGVNKRLYVDDPTLRNTLNHAIQRCINNQSVELVTPDSHQCPYSFTVTPLNAHPMVKGCSVFVYRHDQVLDLNLDTLCRLFSLTEKEGLVCYELVRGYSPAEIAKKHFLSYETVRTYLKRAMKKTGTSRQNELVARLLTSPANCVIHPTALH